MDDGMSIIRLSDTDEDNQQQPTLENGCKQTTNQRTNEPHVIV
jgi:hypothetical protein